MKALILSGGTGTRLRPLTYSHAKQLIPIANKPILFYIIEKLVKAGIRDIGIITGETGEEVRTAVGNGDAWGAAITCIPQEAPLGLAHAVKTAAAFIGDSPFLMILGDNLFSMELDGFLRQFAESGANASVLLHKVKNPAGFGVAVVRNNRIQRLVEKPMNVISHLIITGVYLFDHTIFQAIDRIQPSSRGELEITDGIQMLLDAGGTVTYQVLTGWWKDTGKRGDLLEANRLILDSLADKEETPSPDNSGAARTIPAGQTVRIGSGTIQGPAVLGADCQIPGSRLGPYVSIGKEVTIRGCQLENSIVLDGAVLENIPEQISDSLIGRHAIIQGTQESPRRNSFFTGDEDILQISFTGYGGI